MTRFRWTTLVVVSALVASLAGCVSGGGKGGNPATPATSTKVAATACVTDPAAVVNTPAKVANTDPLPESTTKKLAAAAAASFKTAAAPGAVVAVQSPHGLWTAAYGDADPTAGTPMTTDVYQRIGSVTKTFTGTLIEQLAADGDLSLDDPIDKYVPGVPNGDTITLRQLADMTSGIKSYTKDATWLKTFFAQPEKVWTPDELAAFGLAAKPLFAPGTKFDYSNTNTILLGMVVEKVTGHSLAEEYNTRIIEPLGLSGTSFPGASAAFPSPHAQGYTLQGPSATPDSPTDATDWNPSWGWSAGELISTASDMLVYGRALGTGHGLLPAKAQEKRLSSFAGASGYGVGLTCSAGWVGHTGSLPGYNTTVYYDTASDTTLVIMVNSDIASGDCPEGSTLTDNPTDLVCSSPAVRMFVAVSKALGHEFVPPGH